MTDLVHLRSVFYGVKFTDLGISPEINRIDGQLFLTGWRTLSIPLPEADWAIIGKAKELTEDAWKKIVPKEVISDNAPSPFTEIDIFYTKFPIGTGRYNTAIQSGYSLLLSKGFQIDTTLIMSKNL